jgi:putative acetyltransferase
MLKKWTLSRGDISGLKEVQQLFVDTITSVCSADYNWQQIEVWASSVENEERWIDILTNQFVLFAKHEDKIVGFATLSGQKHIDLFYIHKDYQRQKIASGLYASIEKEAARLGERELTAEVSITARPFFESRGFAVLKQQTVTRKGVAFTNYKMSKILAKL